jgi:hypothetical protein
MSPSGTAAIDRSLARKASLKPPRKLIEIANSVEPYRWPDIH